MKKYNLGLKGLTVMRWLEKEDINLNEKETYNFTFLYDSRITTLIEYREYAPIKKIMNYLLKQISGPYENERFTLDSNLELLTEKQIREFGNCANDWMDYMEWSKELGHVMQSKYVLFPKSLKLAHDKTMKEYQIHENKAGHTVEHAKKLRDKRKVNQIKNPPPRCGNLLLAKHGCSSLCWRHTPPGSMKKDIRQHLCKPFL